MSYIVKHSEGFVVMSFFSRYCEMVIVLVLAGLMHTLSLKQRNLLRLLYHVIWLWYVVLSIVEPGAFDIIVFQELKVCDIVSFCSYGL